MLRQKSEFLFETIFFLAEINYSNFGVLYFHKISNYFAMRATRTRTHMKKRKQTELV